MKTNAAVLRKADGPFAIEEIELDGPGPEQVLVRIAGVGVCHTDFLPRTPMAKPPIVTGHEGAGVVEALGDNVRGIMVGDHVVLSFDSCGECRNCLDAQPAYCAEFWPRNMSGFRPGQPTNVSDTAGKPIKGNWFGQSSFAELAVVSARNVIKVDPALPLELLGPLSCGVLTGAGSVFESLGVEPGSSIVVSGTGTVGLSAVMAARVAGAATIIAVDRNPDRAKIAEKLGATATFTDFTDVPKGLDYALDTTGVPAVMSSALDALRLRGVLGCVGVTLKPLEIRPDQLAYGRTIKGILEGDAVPKLLIPKLIALWQQGRFPFDDLIELFPLDDINDAEQAMKSGAVVKPVLIPSAGTNEATRSSVGRNRR